MRLSYILILSAIIFSGFSCTNDKTTEGAKNTKHIFAKYYVRYLQTEKELKAEVSFKEGDTLSSARSIFLSNVTFGGNTMQVQNLGKTYGIRYNFQKKGSYSKEYTFSYSGDQVGALSHTVMMEPLTDFSIKGGSINKKVGATLIWQGDPLNNNQEIILLFTDQQKKAFTIEIKGPTDKTEIDLSTEQISGLNIGKGELMVIKKQFETSSEDNFSKITEMEFYSNNLAIEVIE